MDVILGVRSVIPLISCSNANLTFRSLAPEKMNVRRLVPPELVEDMRALESSQARNAICRLTCPTLPPSSMVSPICRYQDGDKQSSHINADMTPYSVDLHYAPI